MNWMFAVGYRIASPTGSACGIVLYYMRAPVFPRVCDYHIHLVVRAISLTLKLLEFLRCDAPVSSTLALQFFKLKSSAMLLVGARLFLTLYIGIAISPAIYNSAMWVVLIVLVVSGRRQTYLCILLLRHVLEGVLFYGCPRPYRSAIPCGSM